VSTPRGLSTKQLKRQKKNLQASKRLGSVFSFGEDTPADQERGPFVGGDKSIQFINKDGCTKTTHTTPPRRLGSVGGLGQVKETYQKKKRKVYRGWFRKSQNVSSENERGARICTGETDFDRIPTRKKGGGLTQTEKINYPAGKKKREHRSSKKKIKKRLLGRRLKVAKGG